MSGRPRTFDEEQVLDRAIEVFWRDGYNATSMQSLLSHMGISRQSLYNTFGDKRNLFLAALDRYISRQGSNALTLLEAPRAGYQEILQYFNRLGEFARTSCGIRRACMIGKSCMELAAEDPEVRARVHQHFERTAAAFRHALENAVASGEIAALDTTAVARHLTATVNGLGIMFKAGVSTDELADVIRVSLSVLRPLDDSAKSTSS